VTQHALALAVLGLLAGPAGAAGASVAPVKPCYVSASEDERQSVAIQAQGFTPNGTVSVIRDGVVALARAQVDPAGNLSGFLRAPAQERGQRPFTIMLVDNDDPANFAMLSSLVTALWVSATPRDARPASRVRFRGRGFTDGDTVYGHYIDPLGRHRRTVRFASVSGPCGTFEVRRRQLPIRRPRTGRWTLRIDQSPQWRRRPATIYFRFAIPVRRAAAVTR
jgi:hypothetical protein